MTWYEIVSVVFSLMSVLGGCFSWWRSNLSRKAKNEAETAAKNAQRQLKAIEEQAETAKQALKKLEEQIETAKREAQATEDIAATLRTPTITMERVKPHVYHITNNTDIPVTITRIINNDWIHEPASRYETPVTIAPRDTIRWLLQFKTGGPNGYRLEIETDTGETFTRTFH